MGSSTSTPTDNGSPSDDPSSKSSLNEHFGRRPQNAGDSSEDLPSDPAESRTKNRPAATAEPEPNGLTGMALVHHQCRKPKRRYRKCMNDYYSREFMTGRSMEQDCHDPFEEYRLCVLRGIKAEIWDKQGLPPPKEGSPLADLDDS